MYVSRNIKFKELISIDDWRIKVYTISTKEEFGAHVTYKKSLENLPEWLLLTNSFNPNHDNIAFMIVHEAQYQIFTLLNTWVGENMLQSYVFVSEFDHPEHFRKISGDGLTACVWELEVINHERLSLVNHVLKNSDNPDIDSYLKDTINSTL